MRPKRPLAVREQRRVVTGVQVERIRVFLLEQSLADVGAKLQSASRNELQSAAEGDCKGGAEFVSRWIVRRGTGGYPHAGAHLRYEAVPALATRDAERHADVQCVHGRLLGPDD